jgi:hypothetical protein
MKTTATLFAVALLLATVGNALAVVHYVDLNSTHAMPPFTNGATAATNIQETSDFKPLPSELLRFSPGDFALLIGGPFHENQKNSASDVDALRGCNAAASFVHADDCQLAFPLQRNVNPTNVRL